MADLRIGIAGPNLGGLAPSLSPRQSGVDLQAASQIGQALGQMVGMYGQNRDRKNAIARAEDLTGEDETYEEAGAAVDESVALFRNLQQEREATGQALTEDQVLDLKNQTLTKTLDSHRRIERALARGLISSTEANARLHRLRSEALANPLMAAYSKEFDNVLYKVTGGSENPFAKTAEELEGAAEQKGRLEAIEAVEKQEQELVRAGAVATPEAARAFVASTFQFDLQKRHFDAKKAELGVTSQEAYAVAQNMLTQSSAVSYGAISSWVKQGANAALIPDLQLQIQQDAEAMKAQIRQAAIDRNGNLIMEEATLARLLAEVDTNAAFMSQLPTNQSDTKRLVAEYDRRQASFNIENQAHLIEFAKAAPLVVALQSIPHASDWVFNHQINIEKHQTEWAASANPLLKLIAKKQPSEAADDVRRTQEKLVKNQEMNDEEKALASVLLTSKGGASIVKHLRDTYGSDYDLKLRDIPITVTSVLNSSEWNAYARDKTSRYDLTAIIQGAAQRAIMASLNEVTSQDPKAAIAVPKKVKVTKNDPYLNRVDGLPPTGLPIRTGYKVDTYGVKTGKAYNSEVAAAYEMGRKYPQIWQGDFDSVDDWLSSLFTRQ
jgi:regulator of replication initiation timing